MEFLDATSAERYLRRAGRIAPTQRVVVSELAGGVSNQVLYVSCAKQDGDDFVLKQVRPQLRTPQPWFSSVGRIWRELDVLRAFAANLPDGRTPRVLFEDRENYLFAMTAAPKHHATWKAQLMANEVDPAIATHCGRLLGTIHARTWGDHELMERLGNREIFDELRLDPYYRATARACPAHAHSFEQVIESVCNHRLAMVHGDFSPKNLLVFRGGMMIVDFETGHYGDPAFDLGFFLSHLVLKAFHHAPDHERYLALTERFWDGYRGVVAARVPADQLDRLVSRSVQNFAGCAWSRLDGKSRIDYLDDSGRQERVRTLCREILQEMHGTWGDVLVLCRSQLGEIEPSNL